MDAADLQPVEYREEGEDDDGPGDETAQSGEEPAGAVLSYLSSHTCAVIDREGEIHSP